MSYGPFGWELQQKSKPRKHARLKGVLLPEREFWNSLPPRTRAAVQYHSELSGLDEGAVLIAALSAIASCTQGIADVEAPGGWTLPTSGIFFIALPSGGKKNVIGKAFFDDLKKSEDMLLKTAFGNQFDPENRNRLLIFIKNVTHTKLLKLLKQVGNCILVQTEGSRLFSKWGPDELGTLNDAHDGETLSDVRDGANGHNFKHEGARLTIFVQVPTKIFNKFLKTSIGENWQDVGVFNRSFTYVQHEGETQPIGNPELLMPFEAKRFHDQLNKMLCQAFSAGNVRELKKFNVEAKEIAKQMEQEVSNFSKPGGYLHNVSECAGKFMDKVYRTATWLHLVEGYEGDISAQTLCSAYQIVLYFTDYHVAMFTEYPDFVLNAHEIDHDYLEPLRQNVQFSANRYIYLQSFKSRLPSKLKRKSDFEDSLLYLFESGRISVRWAKDRKGGGWKKYIDLFPNQGDCAPYWLELGGPAF